MPEGNWKSLADSVVLPPLWLGMVVPIRPDVFLLPLSLIPFPSSTKRTEHPEGE